MWHTWWRPRELAPACVPRVVVGGTNPQADPHPYVLSSTFIVQQINQALNPSQTAFNITMRVPSDSFDIRVDTSVSPPISSGTAEIVFINDGGWDKHVTTCSSGIVPQKLTVPPHSSATMTISRASSTTVFLSKDVCTFWFIGCVSITAEHVAVLSESDFWSVVDSRRITFRWATSQ